MPGTLRITSMHQHYIAMIFLPRWYVNDLSYSTLRAHYRSASKNFAIHVPLIIIILDPSSTLLRPGESGNTEGIM